MAIDRANWRAPTPQRVVDPARSDRVVHAVGGSLVLQAPAYAAVRAAIDAFVAPGPPLAVEVGFDHGINLLAHARHFPGWRWLGVELRRHRVAEDRDSRPQATGVREEGAVVQEQAGRGSAGAESAAEEAVGAVELLVFGQHRRER